MACIDQHPAAIGIGDDVQRAATLKVGGGPLPACLRADPEHARAIDPQPSTPVLRATGRGDGV